MPQKDKKDAITKNTTTYDTPNDISTAALSVPDSTYIGIVEDGVVPDADAGRGQKNKPGRKSRLHTIVLSPMWVTLKHLFRRPATIMYPYESLQNPKHKIFYPTDKRIVSVFGKGTFGVGVDIWKNYRGAIGLDVDKCISCGLCARICPDSCINYVDVEIDVKNDCVKDDGGKEDIANRDCAKETDDRTHKKEKTGTDAKPEADTRPEVSGVGKNTSNKTKKAPSVDFGLCMFCGLCAEHCPTGAIFLTSKYDLADFRREDLIYGPDRLGMHVNIKSDTIFPERSREYPIKDIVKCIGCQICAKKCPVGAIRMIDADSYLKSHGITLPEGKKKPKLFPEINNQDCVSCGTCELACPKKAITMDTVSESDSEPHTDMESGGAYR